MQQKDYKAIAEIIKMYEDCPKGEGEVLSDVDRIAYGLANYFEREENRLCKCGHPYHRHSKLMFHSCIEKGCNCGEFKPIFNRQQFLKDCGVN